MVFMRRQPQRILLPLLLGALPVAGVGAAWGEEGSDPWPLTVAVSDNALHSLVLRSTGSFTTMAWVESSYDQPDRLRFLDISDAPLTEIPETGTVALPDHPFILNPDLDVHPEGGHPAFTWVGEGPDGSSVYFALPGEPAQVVYSSASTLEFPVVKFDREGTAHLSWFENVGIHSRVFLAKEQPTGEWMVFSVSEDQNAHDLLPQLFGLEQGVELYWFSVLGGETVTHRGVFAGDTFERNPSPFEQIPPNRWPVFYRPGTAESLGALWLEQTEAGEIYLDLDPRHDPPGSPAALGPAEMTISQVSVSEDPWAAKSWLQEAPGAPGELYGVRPGRNVETRIAPEGAVLESTVSASEGWLNLLWVEDDLESGLLLLRFHRAD